MNYLCYGGAAPYPWATGDVNENGVIDITDVNYIMDHAFEGGPCPCTDPDHIPSEHFDETCQAVDN
jgi:hypothetical protein